jgi:hypothetical protein
MKKLILLIAFKISYHVTFIYYIIKGLIGGKDK